MGMNNKGIATVRKLNFPNRGNPAKSIAKDAAIYFGTIALINGYFNNKRKKKYDSE